MKTVFYKVGFIVLLIIVLSFIFANYLVDQKLTYVTTELSKYDFDYLNLQSGDVMLDPHEDCNILINFLVSFSEEKGKLGRYVSQFNLTNTEGDAVQDYLSMKYSYLNFITWKKTENIYKICKSDRHLILFLYSKDCIECSQLGDELTKFSETNKVDIFAVPSYANILGIELLKLKAPKQEYLLIYVDGNFYYGYMNQQALANLFK